MSRITCLFYNLRYNYHCYFVYIVLLLYISKCIKNKNVYCLEEYNIMATLASLLRYNKNQIIIIDTQEIRLIDHLKELRIARKITKKKISNLVKQNDYWYSQIERDGKKGDDNRQLTIYRSDLIKIIAIVKFGAMTSKEIELNKTQSINYIDQIISAVPVNGSATKIEMLRVVQSRTVEEQERLLESLLTTQSQLLNHAFRQLSTVNDKDIFLDHLKNLNSSLKINPTFMVYLAGMPFAEFLYESKQENLHSLLTDIMKQLDNFRIDINNGNLQKASSYLFALQNTITKYTGKTFMDFPKENNISLPEDE